MGGQCGDGKVGIGPAHNTPINGIETQNIGIAHEIIRCGDYSLKTSRRDNGETIGPEYAGGVGSRTDGQSRRISESGLLHDRERRC